MEIKVLGAAGEVTGSSFLVQTKNTKVLVDAGMFQGSKEAEKNKIPENLDPKSINAILITHSHLDHVGRIPLYLKYGYRNPIYATSPTLDLSELVLQDASKIQMQDAEYDNRHHPEKHVEPLYTPEDMKPFRSLGKNITLHQPVKISDDVSAKFYEAGHIFGSTSIELTVQENGTKKVVVFSGDLGPHERPIVRPFDHLPFANLVFMESTYGNRNHRPYAETMKQFEQIIQTVIEERGKILIPAFAIGRAQQIAYHLAILFFQKKIQPFPVFVDSPMAVEAGKIFNRYPDLLDEEALYWKNQGVFPLDRKWFKFMNSVEESKHLNDISGPCAIIAGAGMCTGGRILHHLKFNLPFPTTHVLIVGYQGQGTLGRQLVDGAKQVRIHGENIEVNARIHTLNGLSAHAGQDDLLKWLSSLAKTKPQVALIHGENLQREVLATEIEKDYQIKPLLPELNDVIEL